MDGYLILYRSFLTWEWYSTPIVKDVFLHCLFKANYKDQNWKGQIIKKGQFVTSLDHLSKELGLTVQQIRTALKKLEKTQNITRTSTSRNTIITVVNWHKFHKLQQTNNKQITNNQQQLNKGNKGNKGNKDITTIINNTHTNTKGVCVELSKEEKEILVKYAKSNGARKVEPYINALIQNGGYLQILEDAKKKESTASQNTINTDLSKINNLETACAFIGKYGDFTDSNHPKEVQQIMKQYGIESYTHAVEIQRTL